MTEKRFVDCFEGIEDKWETVEEYKYTPCTKDGFQDLCEMLNELNDENLQLKEENKKLKEKIKLIFGQIKAFRDDCVTYSDFDGASTLNRLCDILRVVWRYGND